jgi:hypothetical protein
LSAKEAIQSLKDEGQPVGERLENRFGERRFSPTGNAASFESVIGMRFAPIQAFETCRPRGFDANILMGRALMSARAEIVLVLDHHVTSNVAAMIAPSVATSPSYRNHHWLLQKMG